MAFWVVLGLVTGRVVAFVEGVVVALGVVFGIVVGFGAEVVDSCNRIKGFHQIKRSKGIVPFVASA